MAILLSTCAAVAATIFSAQPGDTVQLTADCPTLVEIRNRTKTAPGVTVEAIGRTLQAGLRIWDTSGVTWRGGTIRGGSNGYGLDLRRGERIVFEAVTFTDAVRGAVVNATKQVTIRNSSFLRNRSDGINFVGAGDLGVAENNLFRDFDPGQTKCELADDVVEVGLPKAACTAKGGDWTDTYHPDAIQSWAGWGRLVARNNRVEGETQGINTFGAGPPQRFDIYGNTILINYSAGITNSAAEGSVTGNYVDGSGTYAAKILVKNAVIACGNTVVDLPASAAAQPCQSSQ